MAPTSSRSSTGPASWRSNRRRRARRFRARSRGAGPTRWSGEWARGSSWGLGGRGWSADADQAALGEHDDEVAGDPEQGDRRQGREEQRDVEQAAAGEVDEVAEAALRARPFADDRSDDRQRDADAEATEDRGKRGGDLDRDEHLATARAERPPELEQAAVDRSQPDEGRDRDREEDDQAADHDLREQVGPEPQGEERGEREDRDGLRGDEIRRDQPLDQAR